MNDITDLTKEYIEAKQQLKSLEKRVETLAKQLEQEMLTNNLTQVNSDNKVLKLEIKHRRVREETLYKKNPRVIDLKTRLDTAREELINQNSEVIYELQIALEKLQTNDLIEELEQDLINAIEEEKTTQETYYTLKLENPKL